MKILQVISSFPPAYSYGGALQVAYDISKYLVLDGHHVTVYTTDVLDKNQRNKDFINPEYLDRIEIFRFKNISNRLASNYHVSFAPKIIKALNDNIQQFDLVHCHEYRSFEAIITHHFAIKYNIPYIIQTHGAILPFFEKQRTKKLFDFLWGRQILKDASKLIAVSKIERNQYLQMGIPRNKIEIIPNGVDLNKYLLIPKRGLFREKNKINVDEKIILYLGRVHKRKGIEFLIEGFSTILRENIKVILVIAGPDDGFLNGLKKQVKKLNVEKSVLFSGPLSEEEKLEALVDADVLVYPGTHEIFGLVPFEAIMCSTPVIVTDDCGCGEVIGENKCGSIVGYGSAESLKTQIIWTFEHQNESFEMIKNGQHFINNILAWSHIISNLEVIYQDQISQKHRIRR